MISEGVLREAGRWNDEAREAAVSIHYVIGPGWLLTHGMDANGLPELEMRHVPAFLAESASGLLRHVCDYMLESGTRIKAGETMSVSPRDQFRFIEPEPMPDDEDHYDAERLQIVDLGPICVCCRASKPSSLSRGDLAAIATTK